MEQVRHLLARTRHVKNAIILQYAAISFFILTSLFLFWNVYSALSSEVSVQVSVLGGFFSAIAALTFVIGLILIFLSSVLMMREAALAYHIVDLEAKS